MKRRQEVFGEKNNITVIDDFAHHPTAVEKTLKGLRERFGDRRIIAIFEPRSNTSRSKMFEEDYVGAFTDADMVYISVPPVKKVGFNPDAFMDIEIVSNNIRNTGKDVYNLSSADEIVQHLKDTIKPGDVLVVMSNGDFDGIHQKLLDVC
jgi:UDP-N-acetylmuramate: L-alanyl-gamma-D-glutamyl-meso-diaminopimelate ligase